MQRLKSKIIGFVLVLCMLVSAYTLIVQAVQQFGNIPLITQLSLCGSADAGGNRTQFYAGETLNIRACVSAGDAYSVSIIGKNGSVYTENGRISGSVAVVRVPLDPPVFRAGESYLVVFSACISVYPIPGAFATDTKLAAFAVLASNTTLGLSCDYDNALHQLSVSAALVSGQGAPVANKTITFDLQLNTSSYVQDRGWLPLASEQTDADGRACYVTGCNIISGIQYVKAVFAGDSDFGGSANTTQFTVTPFSPVIQSVNVTTAQGGTQYAVEVTDPNGYPLTGRTVVVQGEESTDPAYGVTDREGTAFVWLNGSDPSKATQNVTVLSDTFTCQSELTCNSSGYTAPSSNEVIHLPADAQQASQDTSGLTVSLSPRRPFAVLPTQVTASYCGWISPGSLAHFTFLLDGVRELCQVAVVGQGNSTYNVPLEWCSDVVGNHSITVNVWGSASDEDPVAFDVDPCPDNLQLYAPQVVYGNQAMFSLVFTIPSQYNQSNNALFSSFNTAPSVNVNGQVYKIDQGVSDTTVSLSLNGQALTAKPLITDANGVAYINFAVNLTANPEPLNFYANKTDNPLYNSTALNRIVSYSKVNVSTGANANQWNKTQYLKLDFVSGGNASQVYVGAKSQVEATAGLFGMPVYDAPVSLTFAKFIPTTYNRTGIDFRQTLAIPAGANFLRVACIYTNSCLDAAIASYTLVKAQDWNACGDGIVNILDIGLVSANWGLCTPYHNPPGTADPLADIVGNGGPINILDIGLIAANWGSCGSYYPGFGAVAHFSDGKATSLDSAGCASIPSDIADGKGAVNFTLNGKSVGAFVEFFNVTDSSDLNKRSLTDTSGAAGFSWTPSEVGNYLVEVKLPQQFSATVSQREPTSVCGPVCTVSYVQVVQRPVDLNVSYSPEQTCYTPLQGGDILITDHAYCSNEIDNDNNYGPYNDSQRLRIGVANWDTSAAANDVFRSYIRFDFCPPDPDMQVTSAMLYLQGKMNYTYHVHPNSTAYEFPREYKAYAVNSSWNSETINNASNCQSDSFPEWYQNPTSDTACAYNYTTYQTQTLTFNVTRIVQLWCNGSRLNYGFVIKDTDETTLPCNPGLAVFEVNPLENGWNPRLEVYYNCKGIEYSMIVNATDPVLGGTPIKGLEVGYFPVAGCRVQTGYTNRAGAASFTLCPNYPVNGLGSFSGFVQSNSTSVYDWGSANVSLDTRYPTCLTCLNGSSVTGLDANVTTNVAAFQLSSSWQQKNLAGVQVNFYVDPSNMDLWSLEPNYTATTNSNGVVWLNCSFSSGTHYVYAVFDGAENTLWQYYNASSNQLCQYCFDDWYQPCNASIVAVATVIPLGIDFGASRQNFAPGTQLTLNATVMDLRYNNTRYSDYGVFVNFTETNSGSEITNSSTNSTYGGAAYWTINYPSTGGARAYKALLVGAPGAPPPQSLVSSPLQLTVGYNTTLLLNVTRDFDSTRHVFRCGLLSDGFPVSDRTITLKLNSTAYTSTTVNGVAEFVFYLSPQANNNQTVYNVVASFSGDPASTATATMTALNGTTYDVCTTTQYNKYMPSSNSTSITVEPQTTIGATTLMNPAQMEKNAEAPGGGLSVYPEFSWWYPWFRLHFAWKYNGQTMLDVGIAILPGADTANYPDTTFKGKINEWFGKIAESVLIGIAATEFALWLASHGGLLYFVIALGLYMIYKAAMLGSNWNSVENLWVSLISTLTSLAISAWTGLCSFLPSSLQALAAGAESIKNAAFAFLCKVIMIPVNIFLLNLTWNRIIQLGGV